MTHTETLARQLTIKQLEHKVRYHTVHRNGYKLAQVQNALAMRIEKGWK